METEKLIMLFKEKCKATYKLNENKTKPIFYVLDYLDIVSISCQDEILKRNCKQAYITLLDYDELRVSFHEIIKMKKKMSDYIAVVSEGNPMAGFEKNPIY